MRGRVKVLKRLTFGIAKWLSRSSWLMLFAGPLTWKGDDAPDAGSTSPLPREGHLLLPRVKTQMGCGRCDITVAPPVVDA
jgi:hypothetical protein